MPIQSKSSNKRVFRFVWAAVAVLAVNGILLLYFYLPGQNLTDLSPVDYSGIRAEYFSVLDRNPPANYDKWVSFAVKNKCPTHPNEYSQIYKDLAPWMNGAGVRLESFDELAIDGKTKTVILGPGFVSGDGEGSIFESLALHPGLFPTKTKFLINGWDEPQLVPADDEKSNFFQYNNPAHVFTESECFRSHFDSILTPNASSYPFSNPNATLRAQHGFFTHPDTFVTKNARKTAGVPLFSQSKADCFLDVLIPLGYHVAIARDPPKDVIPFNEKLPVLFWRGSSTGGSYRMGTTWRTFPRTRLVEWGKAWGLRNPNLTFDAGKSEPPTLVKGELGVDIGFNAFGQVDGPTKQELEDLYGTKTRIPFKTALRFKYLIVVDGNTWPSRLQQYLHTNSIVLYAGIFTDFFNWRLKPWVHYVPVRLDFSDLEERLTWLKENDAEAKEIVKRANEVMKIVNRMEYLQCYAGLALLEYAALVKEDLPNYIW